MKYELRTSSVDATRAVGAAIAALARGGDLVLLAGELGAGKTAFAQGFGVALGVVEPITSPTFVLARDYDDGRLPFHHLDVYRLDQMSEVYDIGLPEVLDDGGVTLIEWGDAIMPSLPADFLEVRLTFGAEDDERTIVVRAGGKKLVRSDQRAGSRACRLGRADAWSSRLLILGIESSTVQIGAAVGGHEGVLAQAHSARGKRHAENLTPTIDFVRRQARVDFREIGCVAVDLGPGLFTGLRVGIASAKALAHALRVPMIGVASLDLLAFPVRFSQRLIVAAIDARRGELFYAMYRQVPGGVQRLTSYQVGTPEDLASELMASGEDCLLVGDGVVRYRDRFEGLTKVEAADSGLAYPTASSLVQLAHARALREEWVKPWELEPLYLRAPDAEINWSMRESAGRS